MDRGATSKNDRFLVYGLVTADEFLALTLGSPPVRHLSFSAMPHITDEELVSEHVKPVNVHIVGGLLHEWQVRNSTATVPHAIEQLRAAGNVDNLRRLLVTDAPPYRGRYPFLDTDLYKTLEGLAYEIGAGTAQDGAREFFDEVVGLLERAQAEDGYLNSYFQDPASAKQPWEDLAWGHELYNLGHLIQAAVAARPADGRRAAARRRGAGSPIWWWSGSAPARRGGRLRPPRGRDGAGRAVQGDRRPRLPRPRRACSSTGAGRAS